MKQVKFWSVILMIGVFSFVSACNTQAEASTAFPTDPPTATLQPTDAPTPTKTIRPTRTPTPLPEGVERVTLMTSDDVELAGFLHKPATPKDSGLVVLLAHGHNQSTHEWLTFETLLVENEFTTMTFDFQGHGVSSGKNSVGTAGKDTVTVVEFLKNEGFERIICIGSSMGGSGCLYAAVNTDISGLVSLSADLSMPGSGQLTNTEVQNLTTPKIFMVSEDDPYPESQFLRLELTRIAGEPKSVYIFPGIDHGVQLIYGENGEEVKRIIFDFLADFVK